MLAARTTATRTAARLARSFATVVDSAGVKVAAVDYGQPTSAVTVLVKAGSRYQTTPGVAHALKNFAFKSTAKRSALGTIREAELYGGILSSSLSREYLALTAEFLRGDEEYFVDLLSSFVTSAKLTRHEMAELVLPVTESESTLAQQDPATRALELAHTLAFRSGLGYSLFAPPHSHLTSEDVRSFASTAFSKDGIAFLGTGIDQSALSSLVQKHLGGAQLSGSGFKASPSAYHGGETRVELATGKQTVFIGYGTTTPSAELAALSAHLSAEPSVKWAQSTSPAAAGLPSGTTVQSVYLPYSDAALFGILVQGPTAEAVKQAGQTAVKALKEATGSGLKAEELKKAVAKAKFQAASATDRRDSIFSVLGSKVLAGSEASADSLISSLDKIDSAAFSKAASALVKAKPTYVAVGHVDALPYPDELGL
ncbi:LuxS/MPP-like metallohydrolase [Gloeophyllum trabeum ATCC 11539]|uniref:Cytochrome b-c1 complex subunit 2, mitochondrial n=1 Tax=Gloeophyllum trabeum (strain ATCC 11539 / FP-39264 / Madison 617) TaxID=670483 RepID=S7RSK8_GLOTA|nr:LuxS/MPP-like metallohydrolase [Gloeophyllum trabeum ATCC 11539]EPQ55999.1 LuxS/MPP-like metallohydrolase [Gloeophyllum trabeum ATCC 11539]